MNELQLGLLGAGAVILIGVVGYNAWQHAKIRRKMPRTPSADATSFTPTEAGEEDAIDERPFIEPLHESSAHNMLANAESTQMQPNFEGEGADNTLAGAAVQSGAIALPIAIDMRIDCIVPLHLVQSVAAEKVTMLTRQLRRAGQKPVFIEGQTENGDWQTLQTGERYRQLRVAVQLANRSGPLNEVEFSEFVSAVQVLADALNAEPDFPDMLETATMARQLDAYAVQCDRQLSINLMSDGAPWSANYVQAVAAQDGLLLSRDGTRFVKLDAQQHPIFMLQFGNTNFLRDDLTYKGGQLITLLLDVPVADEDILPFRLMCDYAASLSQRIGARIVDDQRQPLPEATLRAIEKQLLMLYAKLEEAGLPAGSPAARRLFSH